MRHQRWFPSRISDQIPWLNNLSQKFPGYAVRLGLAPAHVDACVASCNYLVYVLSQWLTATRVFGPACTEAVDLLMNGSGPAPSPLPTFTAPALPDGVAPVPPGVLPRLFDLVQQAKDSPNYTPDIGKDLGIEPHEGPSQTDAAHSHPSPTVKYQLLAGETCQQVQFNFVKHGHQGVILECQRGTGPNEFVGIGTETPYVDERPLLVPGQPEIRTYRLRFWDKGTPNGEWVVLKITVGP